MARTTGPLMSLAASGSVAKTLVFAHWKGRPYVRQLVTPSNPKSTAQYFTRAMMAFLSQAWANLQPGNQSDWDALAKQGNFSPFNAYTRFNMMRWTQQQAPSQNTGAGAGNPNAVLGALTPTAGVGQISLTQVITTIHTGWTLVASLAPHVTGTAPLSAAYKIMDISGFADGDTATMLLTGIAPGTYDLSMRTSNQDGDPFSAAVSHASLVVT